jgi:hypothetical protein
MDKPSYISPDDLARIKDLKIRTEILTTRAEKAAAEARLAAVEQQSFVQHVFLSYGLTITDRIDDNSGKITRAEDGEAEEGAPPAEASEDQQPV